MESGLEGTGGLDVHISPPPKLLLCDAVVSTYTNEHYDSEPNCGASEFASMLVVTETEWRELFSTLE